MQFSLWFGAFMNVQEIVQPGSMLGGWSPAGLLLVLGLLFGMQDMVISGWRSHQWVSYQTVSMGHSPCAAPTHASQYKRRVVVGGNSPNGRLRQHCPSDMYL